MYFRVSVSLRVLLGLLTHFRAGDVKRRRTHENPSRRGAQIDQRERERERKCVRVCERERVRSALKETVAMWS
jgi:hypothetical protein